MKKKHAISTDARQGCCFMLLSMLLLLLLVLVLLLLRFKINESAMELFFPEQMQTEMCNSITALRYRK